MSETRITSLHTDGVCVIEIQERRVGPRQAFVVVVGEVDHSTGVLFHSALTRMWQARPAAVAVDLRQVSFLNAGGLRSLLLASGTARGRGVPLLLQADPGQVSRLLTVVGLGEQIRSTAEVRAEFAAASSSRPALHLVGATGVGGGPGSTPAAAAAGGPARRGDLRPVPDPRPADAVLDEACAGEEAAAGKEPAPAGRRAAVRRALQSRELVGRATGMLMQRDDITADQALGVLTDASRIRNRSIVEVAEELAGT